MKILKAVLMAAVIASFSGTALADESIYMSLDIGSTSVPDFCSGLPATMSCATSATAFRVGAGFQVNSNVGFEATYGNYGKLNVSGTYLGTPISGSGTLSGVQISAIGSLPISEVFSITGKLGVGLLTAKDEVTAPGYTNSVSYDNTTLVYGVGARFNVSKIIALRAQYESLGNIKASSTSSGGTASLISAGLLVGF
jgi:OmpA-OmpF porin, OOP family